MALEIHQQPFVASSSGFENLPKKALVAAGSPDPVTNYAIPGTPVPKPEPTPDPPEEPDPMANIAIIRPRGFGDQFALVPIASVEQARRMGIDGQTPIVVDVDRAQLEAQTGYKLSPTVSGQ